MPTELLMTVSRRNNAGGAGAFPAGSTWPGGDGGGGGDAGGGDKGGDGCARW